MGTDPLGMRLEPPFPHFQQPHSEPRISLVPVSAIFLFFQFFYNPLFQVSWGDLSIQLYFLGDL